MPSTTYKGYSVPTTGTEENTWGDEINANSFGVIDKNIGGIAAVTLSNANVTLTADQSRMLILRLNGTLTGNCQITTACQGMTIVENLTTGSFSVTFTNGVGSPITLAQGARTVVITDATNGPRSAAGTSPTIPSGSSMLFFNSSAPAGWTISTTHNNKAIRLVSSNGGATGGSSTFTSVFASRTPGGTVGNTTLTLSQIPSHSHTFSVTNNDNATLTLPAHGGAAGSTGTVSTNSSGGGGSHTHTFTGSPLDFEVAYVDAIICVKD